VFGDGGPDRENSGHNVLRAGIDGATDVSMVRSAVQPLGKDLREFLSLLGKFAAVTCA
jgi:hypothetical protein